MTWQAHPSRAPRRLAAADLRGCSSQVAACRNVLLGRRVMMEEPGGERPSWRLQWTHHEPTLHCSAEVAVRIGTCRLIVMLEQVDGLLPLLPAGIDFASLPAVAKRMHASMLCGGVIAAIERAAGLGVVVDAVRFLQSKTVGVPQGMGFVVEEQRSRWRSRGMVAPADATAIEQLRQMCSTWEKAPGPIDVARLSVRLRFYLGSTAMPQRGLRALRVGDFIFIQERVGASSPSGLAAAAFLAASRHSHFIGELEQSHMAIQHTDPGLQVRFGEEDAADAEIDMNGMDDLEVSLRFWLGDKHVNVRDLARMQPGEIIPLGRPVSSMPVKLIVGTQCIGRGHLVAVGDQMGVQISAFTNHAQ
jgi:type III secretion system YscQ/HrcQ family protein